MPDKNKATECSFCGKSEKDVKRLIAGPGVPHDRLKAVRSVDLMPTLLDLLGRPVPAGLDGKSLAPGRPKSP